MKVKSENSAEKLKDRLKDAYSGLLRTAGADLLRDSRFISLPAQLPPWMESGIELERGDHVTTLTRGKVSMAGMPPYLWFPPSFQLWFRIGEGGRIFRGTRDTHTFSADSAGKLYLGNAFPGEWADETGRLATPVELYQAAQGGLGIMALRWRCEVEPLDAIKTLVAKGDPLGLLGAEIDRLTSLRAAPAGWHYLWFLGPAEIFHQDGEKTGHIQCRTHGDVGILQREAAFALAPDTRLNWSWKVDALPSEVAENDATVHDYMSIAVEFDNGQDLTYYWSAGLEPETSYRCPLGSWNARETHLVVRSGPDGLGRWLSEERNIYDDYRKAVGGEMPAQIVRVWLIAVSLFQKREGRCEYSDIALSSGTDSLRVV